MCRKKATARGDDEYSISTGLSEEPPVQDTIMGKKKKGSQQQAMEEEEDVEEEVLAVAFSGKRKVKGKKENDEDTSVSGSIVNDEEGLGNAKASKAEEKMADTSKHKKKKKKKKSGRTAQEDDDLDKILAELDEAPPVAKPTVEGEKGGEKEKEESAAAKKKRKKKEKKKEKKAAAEEKVEEARVESESKTADKKVPKHVRQMQEAKARREEMEERKAREEEEKRRKEEEEWLRQEELERQAEEARRRKKEKLLKKKQEGKLLTGKQKEQQKRLEAKRNQFLANSALNTPDADKDDAPSKRPKYQTKKSKPPQQRTNAVKSEENVEAKDKEPEQQGIVAEVESVEVNQVEVLESVTTEENSEVANGVEENGTEDDDDEDWDAKIWDDVNIKVKGAFDDDEEINSEPEPAVKKEVKPPSVSKEPAKQPTVAAKKQQQAASEVPKQAEDLRSPICCIMGHVDAGKTKLLDCIRGTNVQGGEAGGITQQIGATYFPAENIRQRTKELKADATLTIPGLLVIDTPGHESFANLRSRGSGLCDIAILVVDIMDGLEPQTIESLNLLKMRNTEFIVALNKVDRLYGWKTCRNAPIRTAMDRQTKDVRNEFNRKLVKIVTQFKEQGLNTEMYYKIPSKKDKNKEMGGTFSIVPTSAKSGEGIPDLLLLLVYLTQKTMAEKLTFSNKVQCTVLEVKVIEGHGTTIDVVLVNGVLHEGDQFVVCGLQGPIVTTIRALLTPHPMKELRIKGTYLRHKEIKAVQGIKISAQGLEHAIAGTSLYVVGPGDDLEDVKEVAMESVLSRIDKSGEGVYVQASTLGSLEALLDYLKTERVNIPVSGMGIGPLHKKDIMKASVMIETKKKEYAAILAFDVKVIPEARELADKQGVTIFTADIMYKLCDQFKAYIDNIKEERKKEAENGAVFPCVLKILPNCAYNKKDPIILGVDVLHGIAKIGTPICIPQRDFIDIGRIASIEKNEKPVVYAKKGQEVSIKIVGSNPEEQQKLFGRHFDKDDELVSRISRTSIDALKAYYREDLSNEDWTLVKKLKTIFKIQ